MALLFKFTNLNEVNDDDALYGCFNAEQIVSINPEIDMAGEGYGYGIRIRFNTDGPSGTRTFFFDTPSQRQEAYQRLCDLMGSCKEI